MIQMRVSTHGEKAILDDLKKLPEIFDLDATQLGNDLLGITAAGIMINMDAESDPDGNPWPRLDPDYALWKSSIAPTARIGELYLKMKTWQEIEGLRTVTIDTASMEYGTNQLTRSEAIKFTYGGLITGTRQPQRPFYSITTACIPTLEARLDDHFNNAF